MKLQKEIFYNRHNFILNGAGHRNLKITSIFKNKNIQIYFLIFQINFLAMKISVIKFCLCNFIFCFLNLVLEIILCKKLK